jgi:hypothetical protein
MLLEMFSIPARDCTGRSVRINLDIAAARLLISQDLVRRSFNPTAGHYLPPYINSGLRLEALIEAEQPWLLCNCLHTNFVRGNGFVIQDGRLVGKPTGAIALDGQAYQPLNGSYTMLALMPGAPRLAEIVIRQNRPLDSSLPTLAISGPAIVRGGCNCAATVPVRLPVHGQTRGDEINFAPEGVRSSFTALGIDAAGQLLAVSAFAGSARSTEQNAARMDFCSAPRSGLSLVEVADLLVALGAVEAIAGGGSGDTQQYIRGHGLWRSAPRPQPGRPQVTGEARGLGAVLAIFAPESLDAPSAGHYNQIKPFSNLA